MTHSFARRCSFAWFIGTVLFAGIDAAPSVAQVETQCPPYSPTSVSAGNEISGILTDKDIPTGEGGFARDYKVKLESSDQVTIDLTSEEFDTIVKLIASDGSAVAENDDEQEGSTNSLLFARISETGDYIIRVQAFGETGGGKFKLKVTRLRPI